MEAIIGNTYMSSMIDIGTPASGLTYAPANYLLSHPAVSVASYTAWDLQFNYTVNKRTAARLFSWLRGATFGVGCNNVFNLMPPYAGISQAAANNNNNADVTEYSPIGRLYYVQGSVKF
jgi:hypothetical protein